MRFNDAYEQAVASNLLVVTPQGMTLTVLELNQQSFSVDDFLADSWSLTENNITINKQILVDAWNEVASQFTSVKKAESSPFFKLFFNKLGG